MKLDGIANFVHNALSPQESGNVRFRLMATGNSDVLTLLRHVLVVDNTISSPAFQPVRVFTPI